MADDYPQWFNEWLRRRMPDTAQQQTAGKQMRRLLESPEWRLIEELVEARKERVLVDLQRPGQQGVPGQQLPGQQPGMPGMQVDPSQTGFDPQNPYGMDPSQGGFADPYAVGDMTDQQAQQYLGQLFQQQLAPVQQQMQQLTQQNQQLMQQHREAELDRGVADLEQKYPALQDDKAADALVEHVQQLAQQGGRPDLVGEPWFYELAYKAKLADERAAGETPAQPSPALESASGASLAGGEDDPRERIKNAGGPKSHLFGV
jgi:hypothetical protein